MGIGVGSWGRGVALAAGAGAVLGGIGGTIDWPVVATFAGAVEGAVAGAVVGLLLQVVPRSPVDIRLVSAVLAGAAALAAGALGPVDVSRPVGIALVVAAAVLAACLGPAIVSGELLPAGSRPLEVGRWILIGGAVLGAAAGAVVGLIIGWRSYLPTAPFAAVEGAGLGVVSGLVLAGVVAGVAVLPRLRRGP
jgi:hypothetical protein